MDILNYKEIKKGCLIGRFDVKISEWGLTIRGCSYFEKEGKRWLGMPGEQYQSKDGQTKNFDRVVFDKGTRERFEASCLEKIKAGNYQAKQEQPANKIPF